MSGILGPLIGASFGSGGALPQELYAWGYAYKGQTALNVTWPAGNRSSPVQVGLDTDWSTVTGSRDSGASIKTDGTLWTWGENQGGRLGIGDVIDRSSPVQVGALTNWSQVSMGRFLGAAIKTDGTLWTWGNAAGYGLLGNSTSLASSSPVQVGADTDWAQVSAGAYTAGAVKTDGTMWCWGGDPFGAGGFNNVGVYRSSPTQVGALTNWREIQQSLRYCYGIKTDGTIWGWGRNNLGYLGLNDVINYSSPVQIGADTDWATLRAHTTNSPAAVVVKTSGAMWTWGNVTGNDTTIRYSSPVQVGALTNWSLGISSSFCAAIKTDGTLWTWGNNSQGQLGQNTLINTSSPIQVGASTLWSDVGITTFAAFGVVGSA